MNFPTRNEWRTQATSSTRSAVNCTCIAFTTSPWVIFTCATRGWIVLFLNDSHHFYTIQSFSAIVGAPSPKSEDNRGYNYPDDFPSVQDAMMLVLEKQDAFFNKADKKTSKLWVGLWDHHFKSTSGTGLCEREFCYRPRREKIIRL